MVTCLTVHKNVKSTLEMCRQQDLLNDLSLHVYNVIHVWHTAMKFVDFVKKLSDQGCINCQEWPDWNEQDEF